jgi:multiple sugar transport system substrate-binding protein
MNRFKSLLYLLVVFSFILTACTGTPTQPAAAPQPTTESAQPSEAQPTTAEANPTAGQAQAPAGQEAVKLQLWGFAGEYEFLPQIIDDFHALHPNITIEITDIPEGDYITKIDTALLAKEPPDLGYMYERRWLKTGAFAPLDATLQQAGINIDDYNKGVMAHCSYEGKVYCIGTYTGAVLLYYNKDLFDAAGIAYPSSTVPMTIDEYAVMIKKLTKQSDDVNQKVWGGDAGAAHWWIDWQTMFSADGRKTEGFINDEATIHFYDVVSKLPKDGSVMTSAESQLLQGTDLLAQGKLASTIVDNAVAIPTLETAKIRYGAAVPPVEKAGDLPYTPTWTDGYGVFTNSKHPDEAKMFLTYLVKVGNEKQLERGTLSLNLKLAAEKNYGADNEGRKETLEAINVGSRPVSEIPGFWDVVGPLEDGFTQMVEDGTPPSEVLNSIAPDMQKKLDESWEVWDSIK